MKNTTTQYQLEKIKVWLLMAVAFTIPLPYAIALNSVLVILLGVVWLAELFMHKTYARLNNSWIWLFVGIFILYLISGLWAENTKAFGFELEKKLSILLFPLIIGTASINLEQRQKILSSWIAGIFLLIFVCCVNLIRNYFNEELHYYWPDYYVGEGLVFQIHLHRVYVAIHCAFAILVVLFSSSFNKTLKIAITFILSFFIMMLSARIVTLSFFLLIFIYIIFYSKKISLRQISLLSALVICLVSIIFFVPKTKLMLLQLTNFEKYEDVKNVSEGNGVHIRYLVWKAVRKTIAKSPVIGYGAGDSQAEINKEYASMGFELAQKNPYNAHNQYMQIWLDTGIIGFLFLLSFFIISAYQAFKTGNELYFMFLALMFLCFQTENLLSTQKGIVFFAFFNSILYFSFHKINSHEKYES